MHIQRILQKEYTKKYNFKVQKEQNVINTVANLVVINLNTIDILWMTGFKLLSL